MRHAFSIWMESGEFPYGDYNITDDQPMYIDHPHSGKLTVNVGDYVIKGTSEGDFYPCSAEVFDQTYIKTPSTFAERIEQELAELQRRRTLCDLFIQSEVFKTLTTNHRDALKAQSKVMAEYATILTHRLELLS